MAQLWMVWFWTGGNITGQWNATVAVQTEEEADRMVSAIERGGRVAVKAHQGAEPPATVPHSEQFAAVLRIRGRVS